MESEAAASVGKAAAAVGRPGLRVVAAARAEGNAVYGHNGQHQKFPCSRMTFCPATAENISFGTVRTGVADALALTGTRHTDGRLLYGKVASN
jgi:hypothetical protein